MLEIGYKLCSEEHTPNQSRRLRCSRCFMVSGLGLRSTGDAERKQELRLRAGCG